MKQTTILNRESLPTRVCNHVFLILAAFVSFGPFVWMFLTSIKTYEETIHIPLQFLPEAAQWQNFAIVSQKLNFPRLYLNTILVTLMMIVGQMLIVTICAYAFDRLKFPGKNVLFLGMLALMMVPSQIFIIPRFKMMVAMGLTNTLTGLVLPGLFNVFGVERAAAAGKAGTYHPGHPYHAERLEGPDVASDQQLQSGDDDPGGRSCHADR